MRVTQVADVKDDARPRRRTPVLWPWALVIAAWTLAGLSVLTNQSYLINHHYLLEQSHLPVLVALVVFLACWQVMTVGMMLPSSMPMVYMIVHAGRQQKRPHADTGSVPGGLCPRLDSIRARGFSGRYPDSLACRSLVLALHTFLADRCNYLRALRGCSSSPRSRDAASSSAAARSASSCVTIVKG